MVHVAAAQVPAQVAGALAAPVAPAGARRMHCRLDGL
eukprot:COSAG01_NODE_40978_length_457_cov_0.863128_1_plen_36_part_01